MRRGGDADPRPPPTMKPLIRDWFISVKLLLLKLR